MEMESHLQSGAGPNAPQNARIARFESARKQRWGRPQSRAAAKSYNALAQSVGLTPTQLALAFCYIKLQVAGGQHHHWCDVTGAAG